MAPLKKHLTPIGRGGIVKHQGKGATEQVLPSRHAMQTLTQGDPGQRSMNDYAKATPMASPTAAAPDINGLGSGDWPGAPG
jgi:hypothetical protein